MRKIKGKNGGTLLVSEKGESGNPKGRPKGKSFKRILKEALSTTLIIEGLEEAGEITAKEALALLLIKDAIDPNADPYIRMKAAVIVMEKIEGKPIAKKELTGKEGSPLIASQTNFLPDSIHVTVTGVDKSKEVIHQGRKIELAETDAI